MFQRLLNLPKSYSYFLFGARGTGKTTLLNKFAGSDSWYIDLLNLDIEDEYRLDPELLARQIDAREGTSQIIIDEIQKLPKLLDVVHRKIGETEIQFVLTGSSARKLKRGSANLLAGRAFVLNLYPLSFLELGEAFDLSQVLKYGSLPEVFSFSSDQDKLRYLKAYANTYIKEEVWAEQLVRNLDPFRYFLDVAAQTHGEIVNYTKIARDVGVDNKTVQNYFQILEETLIAFILPSFHRSVRKRQRTAPKFYFYDSGLQRTLNHVAGDELRKGSAAYGMAFEHFVIREIITLSSYFEKDFRFSYLRSEAGAEIDLVIEKGNQIRLIEIKSKTKFDIEDAKHLKSYRKDFPDSEQIIIYDGTEEQNYQDIKILPWQKAIKQLIDY